MSEFSDRLMVKFLEPAKVLALLTPPSDPSRSRVRRLLESVYEFGDLIVHEVDSVTVQRTELQVPVTVPVDLHGTWEKYFPQSERAFATVSAPRLSRTRWVAMRLQTRVTVKVEVAAGAFERLVHADLSDVATLAEFEARFMFIDVQGFMAQAGVSTFQELKRHLPQLLELHFADPPAFDPADPAAKRTLPLTVCAQFFPTVDLEGALRQIKASRQAVDATLPREEAPDGGEAMASCAWMAVFPANAQPPGTLTVAEVERLFRHESTVAVFEAPA